MKSAMSPHALESMVNLACSTPRKGCFVEVGVWQGGSAQWLYTLAQMQERRLYLFDTFTGIPMKSEHDVHNIGDFDDGVDVIEIQRAMPEAIIYPGVFPFTIPNHIGLDKIAFVHEDTDQYPSTKAVIEWLYPRLVSGGIMLFDDYNTHDCPGSKRAIDESGLPLQWAAGKAYTVKP